MQKSRTLHGRQHLLFIGNSEIRQLFQALVDHVKLEPNISRRQANKTAAGKVVEDDPALGKGSAIYTNDKLSLKVSFISSPIMNQKTVSLLNELAMKDVDLAAVIIKSEFEFNVSAAGDSALRNYKSDLVTLVKVKIVGNKRS